MRFAVELAVAKFEAAAKFAAANMTATQCDAHLCEDDQTVFVYCYAGDHCIIACVTLPAAIDPSTFDSRGFESEFMDALTARPEQLN